MNPPFPPNPFPKPPHRDPDDWELEHAWSRWQDAEDIATGRRTPEQVQRDNTWFMPDPRECKTLNLIEACEAL